MNTIYRLCFFITLCCVQSFAFVSEGFIRQQEIALGIPEGLLRAIACTESGRRVGKKMFAWPWTVNVEGRGYRYKSKHEAINAVKKFQKQGKRSIDVGCMQINLKHHPHAFRSLEEAFDPQLNVAYGAKFLLRLLLRHGNWHTAVGHYHSSTPSKSQRYRGVVLSHWKRLSGKRGKNWQKLLHYSPYPKSVYKIDAKQKRKNSNSYRNDLYALQLAHHKVLTNKRPMKVRAMTIGASIPIKDKSKFISLQRARKAHSIKGTVRRFIPLS